MSYHIPKQAMKDGLIAEWLLYEAENAVEGENLKECWPHMKQSHALLSKSIEHHNRKSEGLKLLNLCSISLSRLSIRLLLPKRLQMRVSGMNFGNVSSAMRIFRF